LVCLFLGPFPDASTFLLNFHVDFKPVFFFFCPSNWFAEEVLFTPFSYHLFRWSIEPASKGVLSTPSAFSIVLTGPFPPFEVDPPFAPPPFPPVFVVFFGSHRCDHWAVVPFFFLPVEVAPWSHEFGRWDALKFWSPLPSPIHGAQVSFPWRPPNPRGTSGFCPLFLASNFHLPFVFFYFFVIFPPPPLAAQLFSLVRVWVICGNPLRVFL